MSTSQIRAVWSAEAVASRRPVWSRCGPLNPPLVNEDPVEDGRLVRAGFRGEDGVSPRRPTSSRSSRSASANQGRAPVRSPGRRCGCRFRRSFAPVASGSRVSGRRPGDVLHARSRPRPSPVTRLFGPPLPARAGGSPRQWRPPRPPPRARPRSPTGPRRHDCGQHHRHARRIGLIGRAVIDSPESHRSRSSAIASAG